MAAVLAEASVYVVKDLAEITEFMLKNSQEKFSRPKKNLHSSSSQEGAWTSLLPTSY
jgi:hypothetical protein